MRYGGESVIQKYVHNPLLLDGYKFDLRIYVLVTSFSPLEAFIYRRGFARLSTHKYSMDPRDIDNKFVHLTNASVQRYSQAENVTLADASEEDGGGTKISLEYLWRRLEADGHDVKKAWANVIDVAVKSLVCVDDVIPHQPNSFEVFGYDVLFDTDLRAWLLEVNASPSMSVDSVLDARVKMAMIRDTVRLVDPAPFDHAVLADTIRRRIEATQDAKRRPQRHSAARGLYTPSGHVASEEGRRTLDADFARLFHGFVPRAYGEMPAQLGDYERICPGSPAYNRVIKLKYSHFAAKGRSKMQSAMNLASGDAGPASGGVATGAFGAVSSTATKKASPASSSPSSGAPSPSASVGLPPTASGRFVAPTRAVEGPASVVGPRRPPRHPSR